MRKLAIAVALLLCTSDAAAKKKPIMTGDPLPKKSVVSKQCHDKGAVRLIGSEPSTPFATIKKGTIKSAGDACCAQWARRGARYKTVDAHGQIVGEAEIVGGEGYDVTQCYELDLATKNGKPGVGLYVDGDYVAPKSAAWVPSNAERASLAKVAGALELAMVKPASYACPTKALPFDDRTMFFHADGARWAVVGGPLLVVARLYADGRWIAHHVDALEATTCTARAHQPRAVFDINDDGRPEIFLHHDLGEWFGDSALGLENGQWSEVAAAVHGSTA